MHGSPTTPAHVAELLRLSKARAGAEIAWSEALVAALERGDYLCAGEAPKGAAHAALRGKAARTPVARAARPTATARAKARPKKDT
jgi:hypothetical protein